MKPTRRAAGRAPVRAPVRAPALVAALAMVLVAGLTATTARAADAPSVPTTLTVDRGTALGPVNRHLVGVGWHYHAGAPLSRVGDLRPHLVRIDASLQDVAPAPGVLHLDTLVAKVAEVRAIGGEPLVILSYMPAWLGAPRAFGRDPTRVPPSNSAAWEQLVYDVVHRLATAPAPATAFEAWNEPDVPIFWQDLPTAWVDVAERSARAVARVERDTGVDLRFGGPAMAFPDPVYLGAFLARFRNPELPLDFVSWHYYGNYPFLGPDGAEFGVTEPAHPVVGRRNPAATPASFGAQIHAVRAWVTAGLAGSGRPLPALYIDEWNVSAGGWDTRHDTHEGAAFAAATLVAMQEAGLDASAFFKATDTAGVAGEHGLVDVAHEAKPAWWSFWLWQRLADQRVAVTGGAEGLWAVAAANGRRVTVLVASFSASAPVTRTIDVDLPGLRVTAATVRRIDAGHPEASGAEPLDANGGTVRFDLPAQAVALVELTTSG